MFYNLPEKIAQNLAHLFESEEGQKLGVLRTLELYKIKKYYTKVAERNKAYYKLLSNIVEGEDPFSQEKPNHKLSKLHEQTLQ